MYTKSLSVAFVVLAIGCAASFKLQPRILNGYTSGTGQHPYHAFLYIVGNDGVPRICSGTLLNRNFVLTAAHCLEEATEVAIHLGMTEVMNFGEEGRSVISAYPRSFQAHPEYSPNRMEHDIALIKFSTPVEFNNRIQPAKLPKTCESYEDLNVIAIGNGETAKEPISNAIRYAEMMTTSTADCTDLFGLKHSQGIICVDGSGKQSICRRDDGGALLRHHDKTLIGVASFSHPDGCDLGYPQVFTKILAYGDWISKVTGLKLPKC